MPKFAHYNPAANPSPVYGWYNTDIGSFPHLPEKEYLLALTEAQWAARNSQEWQVQNGHLVPVPAVPLSTIQQAKLAELSAACQSTIFAGFDSSALGTAHHYPAKEHDQTNLAGSVLASILPGLPGGWATPFWCADAGGTWSFVAHTPAQIQQVGTDAKLAIIAALGKNASLGAQVMACTTAACVAAITW